MLGTVMPSAAESAGTEVVAARVGTALPTEKGAHPKFTGISSRTSTRVHRAYWSRGSIRPPRA